LYKPGQAVQVTFKRGTKIKQSNMTFEEVK
jgi:hypothetical protein